LLLLSAAAAALGAVYWLVRPEPLALRLFDNAGQLRISWDGNARPVRSARTGHLEIADGAQKMWIELDAEQLRNASVTYSRRSSNVTVGMVVLNGATTITEVEHFWGPAATAGCRTRLRRAAPRDRYSRLRTSRPMRLRWWCRSRWSRRLLTELGRSSLHHR
jgi:hypothetical protein